MAITLQVVQCKAERVIRNAYDEADLTDRGTMNIKNSLSYGIVGLVGADALPATWRLYFHSRRLFRCVPHFRVKKS